MRGKPQCLCVVWCPGGVSVGPYRRYCDEHFLVWCGAREPQSGFPDGAGFKGGLEGGWRVLSVVDVLVIISDKLQQSARTWRCPTSSSSTEWWTFPLCSSDVYHSATVQKTGEQFIARVRGHSSCTTETVFDAFSRVGYGGDKGFFGLFGHFSV